MGQHAELRARKNQHHPKNGQSKKNDKDIYDAMVKVKEYLEEKDAFKNYLKKDYVLDIEKKIDVSYMIDTLRSKGVRKEFNNNFANRTIVPDGGVLFLKDKEGKKYTLVIAEIKRQGTNSERIAEGKRKQATGNAIERLGKNLIGIRAMMNYEDITPFVCFGWGCDFDVDNMKESGTVLSKVVMMNQFYDLNRIYIYKRDGNHGANSFSPVSMFFRLEEWTVDEMFDIMKEIAECSIRYYLY